MEKPKIYLETTIPSYLVARASRDLLIAAHQQVTRTWWDEHRGNYNLFVSEFVIAEIAFGEEAMADARRSILAGYPLLDVNAAARELTRLIMSSGILPPTPRTSPWQPSIRSTFSLLGTADTSIMPASNGECSRSWRVTNTCSQPSAHPRN